MLTINRLRPRMNPWHFLNQMHEEINREFSDWFDAAVSVNQTTIGVWTRDGEAIIAVELPGLNPEDVDVSIHRDVVSISATPSSEELPEGARSLRRERSHESIERQIRLPFEPQHDKVEANYVRGLLVLRLFADEADQPKKITVNAG